MTRRRRRAGMGPREWAWVVFYLALMLAARWWLTGAPPWPAVAG